MKRALAEADGQDRRLKQMKEISSVFAKIGHEILNVQESQAMTAATSEMTDPCSPRRAGRWSSSLGQFARFCVVGVSNTVIDFGVLNAALAAFPTRATVPLLAYNTAAVVLAATNSFVWNRRFTFRVRGPLRAGEVARFAVVAAGTAGLGDLVLLSLSSLFPALIASGALGANMLKLGAILGAMALSFFGMRFWVFLGRWLSLTHLQK